MVTILQILFITGVGDLDVTPSINEGPLYTYMRILIFSPFILLHRPSWWTSVLSLLKSRLNGRWWSGRSMTSYCSFILSSYNSMQNKVKLRTRTPSKTDWCVGQGKMSQWSHTEALEYWCFLAEADIKRRAGTDSRCMWCFVLVPCTIELMLPVNTLTMWASLPPAVVDVQLPFILIRQQKHVAQGYRSP